MEIALKQRKRWIVSGLAMFSMFFGAGNVIFPLIVGQMVMGGVFYALLGLILTAVVVPFCGLYASTLFQSDYNGFFSRIGKIPGSILIFLLMCILGPFGGIPRCVGLTYATISLYVPGIPLIVFSALFAVLIYFCCVKRRRIIDIVGSVMTPALLLFLGLMVFGAFFSWPGALTSHPISPSSSVGYGLLEGYNTMDLLATFFFSGMIYARLKQEMGGIAGPKEISQQVLKASSLGAVLLALVYIGLSIAAAIFSPQLAGVSSGQYLGEMGRLIFGTLGGVIVSAVVFLSCLTTAIALACVSGEYVQEKIFKGRIKYKYTLMGILGLTVLVSTLEFTGIVTLLAPVLQVFYPALVLLSLLNIAHKLFGMKMVKLPFYGVVSGMLIYSASSLLAA